MKISAAEVILVEIPFHLKGTGIGIMPTSWNTLEFALIKLTDELGNVGWGEGFGYSLIDATKSVIERLIFPTLVGQEITNIPEWNLRTQRQLHMFGRYGVTVFGISGVDIALWDLAAKRARKPLCKLLAETPPRDRIPFYASMVRYTDVDIVKQVTRNVLQAGFDKIKLHEIALPTIQASRVVAGPDVSICVDVNCAWTKEFVLSNLDELRSVNLAWLEEPVFPPEDFHALNSLRKHGIPIAAGENWCTRHQIETALKAEAVDYLQPSITKVGGVSELLFSIALAGKFGVKLMPHTPYFGPGLYAALHVAAAHEAIEALEYNFVHPVAWLSDVEGMRSGGFMNVPSGLGIGFEPNPDVLKKFSRKIGERIQ